MRLGEIRNIIHEVLTDENKLFIEHESIFGGQAQQINNYNKLISALDILSEQSWNDVSYEEIESIKKEFDEDVESVQVSQDIFNKINNYINNVNNKLPYYISILDTMVEDQDEKVINIKLPNKIKSLQDLDQINKNLETLFKKLNVGGEFQFKGFDTGTEWYIILLTTEILYRYFIGCLDVALKMVTLKKTYYESKQAKLSYLTSLEKLEDYNIADQNKFSDRYIEVSLAEEVKQITSRVGNSNGKTGPELESQLIMATTELVKQLGDGVEFHLSLNPPKYVEEKQMGITIDYKKMPAIKAQDDKKTKGIEPPKKEIEG